MNNIDIKADIRCVETQLSKKLRPICRFVYWVAAVIFIFSGFDSYHFGVYHYWWDILLVYSGKMDTKFFWDGILLTLLIIVLIIVFPFIFSFLRNTYHKYICKNSFLSVNEERVEGTYFRFGIFKKSFTFPIEQIVNIVTLDSFIDRLRSGKTLVLHTSSGKIRFSFVQNTEEISSIILNAVKEYKENYGTTKHIIQENANNIDEVERLKQYKELLDSGIISQEEFETKKKELLNI